MTAISEIEVAVAGLSREDLSIFRNWFQEFDADAWDKPFEAELRQVVLMHSLRKH